MTLHNTSTTFAPNGNFDLLTVRRAETACAGATAIHFELADCEWLNTEAIAFLLRLHHAGVKVTIANPPPLVHEALRILELTEIFAPMLRPATTTGDPQ